MTSKILLWTPRILTVFTILFMLLFSLDSFDGDASIGKKLFAFLMHNIPVLVLIIILIIAWKWEVAGGVLMIAAFIAAGILFRSFTGNPVSLIVISPILITGILFIIHGKLYNKNHS